MSDRELISAAVAASGLTVSAFARDVLTRDPRTVFRWLQGPTETQENGLPESVRERLELFVAGASLCPCCKGTGCITNLLDRLTAEGKP